MCVLMVVMLSNCSRLFFTVGSYLKKKENVCCVNGLSLKMLHNIWHLYADYGEYTHIFVHDPVVTVFLFLCSENVDYLFHDQNKYMAAGH